ncbi:hypothetical protein [Kribbella flavida]|uniref:hypothetical protein n=1 Tax=Kribbella flavida TaxID=182640 RepID=UPI00019BEA17|nr:hypothetical protein [Kribbella flavida]
MRLIAPDQRGVLRSDPVGPDDRLDLDVLLRAVACRALAASPRRLTPEDKTYELAWGLGDRFQDLRPGGHLRAVRSLPALRGADPGTPNCSTPSSTTTRG